jgi:hypothetical protein
MDIRSSWHEPGRYRLAMTDQDPTRVEQAVDPTSVFAPEGAGGPPTRALPPTGGPPPPDRRPWIIAAVLALIVLMLVLLLVLQGDDDDDGDVDASSTTTTAQVTSTSSSSSSSTSTSTTAEPTTTVAPVVTVPPDDCADAGEGAAKPGLAAETVYDAWVRGDEACAAELMTAPALAELFSRDGEGANDTFQECFEEDLPDPHTDCAFTYEGGSTHYLMNFSPTDGWQVYDITQIAD